jgi:hypothetical protein
MAGGKPSLDLLRHWSQRRSTSTIPPAIFEQVPPLFYR